MRSLLDEIIESRPGSLAAQVKDLQERPDHVERRSIVAAFEHGCRSHVPIIAEIKRASPTRGKFPVVDAVERARLYETAGVEAVSIITEPTFFHGRFEDLRDVAMGTSLPVLCKDFITTREHLELAANLGASAALIIARYPRSLALVGDCVDLGMEPLVEIHDERDLDAIRSVVRDEPRCRLIGVNSRDLATMHVNLARAECLYPEVKATLSNDPVLVAESGITSPRDVAQASRAGADGFLIGSMFMRSRGDHVVGLVRGLRTAKRISRDVKVCGVRDVSTARLAARLGATLIGIVMGVPSSPRNVDVTTAQGIVSSTRGLVASVLVTSALTPAFIDNVVVVQPDFVQYHDAGNPPFVDELRAGYDGPVIHAISPRAVGTHVSLLASRFRPGDLLLLDGSAGTGVGSEAGIMEAALQELCTRFSRDNILVAGGLTPSTVRAVIDRHAPGGVDVSSGVESAPGVKDPGKIEEFITASMGHAAR